MGQTSSMANEFTAIVERDGEWFIAYCPEIPGANAELEVRVILAVLAIALTVAG